MSPHVRTALVLSFLFPVQALLNPARAQCREWDTRFGLAGVEGYVESFALFDDGNGPELYAGGRFTAAGTAVADGIARWNGSRWSALGAGIGPLSVDPTVKALTVFDDGNGAALYAGGKFTLAGNSPAHTIAKWDGTAWAPLGSGLDEDNPLYPETGVTALAVFDDGSGSALYAAGEFSTAGAVPVNHVARWNGTSWSPVGGGLSFSSDSGAVRALTVFDDGSGPALYAAGMFKVAPGTTWTGLAKWDGTSWFDVGAAILQGNVYALTVFDGGSGPELIAGGGRVAAWNGATWRDLTGQIPGGRVDDFVVYDIGQGPELFVSGSFASLGGVAVQNVARWDGVSWAPVGGFTGLPFALIGHDDGSGAALYVGGGIFEAGGVQAKSIARWNGSSWSSVASPPVIEGTDWGVSTLKVFNEGGVRSLYAGGGFRFAGGVLANGVAKWRGNGWSALGSGVNASVEALAQFDDGSGPSIYAGGDFTQAGGAPASGIAKWDGSSWSPVGAGFEAVWAGFADARVWALTTFDDGSGPCLIAAGFFSNSGATPLRSIAKWDGQSWTPLGGGLDRDANVPGAVTALAVFDDGTGPALFAGGSFTHSGGVAVQNVAKWDGTAWSALGVGNVNNIQSFAVFDDGSGPALYAGSDLYSSAFSWRTSLTRWNGTSWASVAYGWRGFAWDLTVFDDGSGPALYAAGYFRSGTQPPAGIVRWNGTSWYPLANAPIAAAALATYQDPTRASPSLFAGGGFVHVGDVVSAHIAEWRACDGRVTSFCSGDGSAAACPCANTGSPGSGCDNSASTGGAQATGTGSTSPDTFVITSSGETASALSLFLQSPSPAAPLPFGDGLRCLGGSPVRLFVKNAVGGTVAAPSAGDPSITTRSAALGDPIASGTKRHYQVVYRDSDPSFCAAPLGSLFNLSNAIQVTW